MGPGRLRATTATGGRGVVALAVVLVVLGLVGTTPAPARPRRPRRPNILFVLADDLDLREMPVLRHVRALVGEQGATFRQYLVSDSLCCPSRTTTLRGQYAHDTGVESNGGSNGGFEAAHRNGIERSTIGTWLHAAGYRTALIGKYLNGYPNSADDRYVPPGWDDWVSPTRGGNPYNEYGYTLNVNGRLVGKGFTPSAYGTGVYMRAASDFIRTSVRSHHPFFAYVAPYAPHRPATPAPRDLHAFDRARVPHPPSYDERNVRDKPAFVRVQPRITAPVARDITSLYRRRIESLLAVDRGVARLVGQLRREHVLASTYVVFASDNGFHLGEHRLPAGKETAYDEDVHVPLLVRGPGIEPGSSVRALAGNVDLAPTFAALARVRAPRFVDGRSLVPLLHEPAATPTAWRRSFLLEHWQERAGGPSRAPDLALEPPDPDQERAALGTPQHGRERWLDFDDIPDYRGLRTDRYTYVEYATGERELYDRRADPWELHDRAATAAPALLAGFHTELRALETCQAVGCRRAERADPGG